MSDNRDQGHSAEAHLLGRRRLIRALGIGSAGLAASRWSKPLIDSVVVPLHAQATPPTVSPGRLFAISGAGAADSTLYELNPANGAVLDTIGATGFFHVTGLAFHPDTGVLYGATSPDEIAQIAELIIINPVTGVGTEVGPTGEEAGTPDMTFDSGGTLYAWSEDGDDLVTISLATGAISTIGSPIGTAQTGLQFDSSDTLYLKTGNTLHEIDPSDGTSLGSVAISVTGLHNILAWDGSTLYGVRRTAGGMELYTIDPATGTATLLGSNAITDVSALAFS
jgi:hypothetical protein